MIIFRVSVVFAALISFSLSAQVMNSDALEELSESAQELERLHNVVVLHRGDVIVDESIRGPGTREPSNIKSLSKSVLSLLVGIAIDKGVIDSDQQKAVDLLGPYLPDEYDPRFEEVTVAQLLSMQSGLQSTSGELYGDWVNSDNWTQYAITRPMIEDPGTRMIYSTGNSHILAAILTEQTGKSLLQLAREWIGQPLNIRIYNWQRSPEGVYFGGNDMMLSTHALARIGEVYRNDGVINGNRIVSKGWIEDTFAPNTRSIYTDDPYGYGWFLYSYNDVQAYYGRGFGGQVIFIIPELELTIAITSDPTPPSRRSDFRLLKAFVGENIIPYVRSQAD